MRNASKARTRVLFCAPLLTFDERGYKQSLMCFELACSKMWIFFTYTVREALLNRKRGGRGVGEKTRGRITISVHTHTYIRSCVCVKNNFPFHINHPGCSSRKVREACLRCLLSSCNFLISINIHALEVRLEVAGAWTLNFGLLVILSPKTCSPIKSRFMAFNIISHLIKLSQWALWLFWTQIHAIIYVKWGKLRQIHKHTIDV